MYRSVPLIRPPILYTTFSPKRGGGVFSSTQLVSIIRPLKKFCYVYDTAKVSYKVQTIASTCSWSSCVVSLHRREELPLQLEGHNIHDAFAGGHPQEQQYCRSWTTGISRGRVAARWLVPSASTVTTRSARETICKCRLDIPKDAHQGGVITSQTTLCRNLDEKEVEGVFSKGAY